MNEAEKSKRIPNPPQLCIFCGGNNLSREHVFAKWMRPYMKEFPASLHIVATHSFDLDTGEAEINFPKNGKLARPGDSRSKRLRVVCETCNNGWMSILQENAKTHLTQLLIGKMPRLTATAQHAIATWAQMFTIVWEQADTSTACINADERKRFMDKKIPGHDWFIFIAQFSGQRRDGAAWHRGFALPDPKKSENQMCYENHPQVTILAAGKVFIVALCLGSFMSNEGATEIRKTATQLGLRRIWPIVTTETQAFRRSNFIKHDEDFPKILNAFSRVIASQLHQSTL